MKIRTIVLIVLAFSTTIFAEVGPPYDNSKPPPLLLPAAYQFAVAALGSATNEFHCVSASMTRDFGAPRWSFRFYSTNQPPRWKCLTVDKAGNVQEDSGARS